MTGFQSFSGKGAKIERDTVFEGDTAVEVLLFRYCLDRKVTRVTRESSAVFNDDS